MERDKDEHASQHERQALDSKNAKSTRKKKAASGKKSKKKKSKQELQPEQFGSVSAVLDDPGSNPNRGEEEEGLEKAKKGAEIEKSNEMRSDNGEKIESQHSMSRSRSGSGNRFSSLFRRKKRCKSETDLRKEKGNTKSTQDGEESKQSESPRRRSKRHVSVDDLKRKQLKQQEENPSPQPQKSNLKSPSPYREFSPTSRPRDRLQHMTLREVAKEQRERRSESLPRRRREFVSFNDREDPMSSPNLSASPMDFEDQSPTFANSHTLPRDSSRYTSLTPQHSSNNFPSNIESGGSSLNPRHSNDHLQRPTDNIMESSQDSGVIVLGQKKQQKESSVTKQEKSSMEKLLELKRNFPHAFSYDVEKDTTLKSKGEEEKNSPQNASPGDKLKESPTHLQDEKLESSNADPSLQSETLGEATSPPLYNDVENEKKAPDVNQTSSKENISPTASSTASAHTTAMPPHITPTRQQIYPATKITSSPSFLAPYRKDGGKSGASSRVTSMTSSHRSSDLGYVDGDDSVPDDDYDDDEDDDNSAFSTPPEDLISESHKHKSYIHPEMLEKYLSSVIQNNSGQNMPLPEIDIYEVEQGKRVYPNSTLPSSSRKMMKPYETYEVRKASRNLKRSSSDVIDRRHKTSPKNFSGAVLGGEHSTPHKSPVGSIDTLSDMSLGNNQATDTHLSKVKDDADGDRDSLTSTGTLTHSDGKSLVSPVSPETVGKKEERSTDIKSVPVMGTAAQSIYRRNFSPLRTRKVYSPEPGSSQEQPQKDIQPNAVQQQQNIPKTQLPEEIIRSASFQPISSPEEDVSINASAFQNIDKDDKDPLRKTSLGANNDLPRVLPLSNEPTESEVQASDLNDPVQNIDNQIEPQSSQSDQTTPAYIITGLELQEKSTMPKNIDSLVDCLNDQTYIGQKNEEKRKTSIFGGKRKEKPKKKKKSRGIECDLKEPTDVQQNENAEEKSVRLNEAKPVSLEDKECQTPPWLLDDLIALKTEPNKKSKGLLGRRKKHSVVLKPITTQNNRENLEIPSTSINVSPSTASFDGVYVTPPSTTTDDKELILRLDAPISPESGISTISFPASSSKSTESSANPKDSDDSKAQDISPGVSKEVAGKPTPKSKPLSLSAVILLKNRIKNYRDKKKEKKDAASGKKVEEEEVNEEPESPTDAFMTIENEINLSKLEVSRETDILDADYFEPEFSLDYSKKQIRFEDITPPNEPVQSEEPLPPLPPTATRRLRQRRESTMRERRRKCLSYCKRFVAFLFSHIGLCSLVVAYTILGGFIFQALESHAETAVKTDIKTKRAHVLDQILAMAMELEKSEEGMSNLSTLVNSTLLKWQADIHHATKDQGWDGTEKMGNEGVWSFASSLLYAITVTTTIGYGHVAPKTPEGRLVTIGYAVVGIPLTLLCLTNIGDVMATGFRLLYGKVCCGICCTMFKPRRRRIPPDLEKGLGRTMITSEKEESDKPKEVIHVPTSLCLLLIAAYIFAGAMLFSMWEKWDILTGSYFCFITLSTIGFGDIVPGMETNAWSGEEKLVLCALYLVLGLSLIAMCFNLVQEDVKTKCRWLGMKLGIVDKPETPM